jgi:hypothetical protein
VQCLAHPFHRVGEILCALARTGFMH